MSVIERSFYGQALGGEQGLLRREFNPETTPLTVLRDRGIHVVGVVPVVLHEGEKGVEVLIGLHKAKPYEPDGRLGLPRETTKWDEAKGVGEELVHTAWRCFDEELGVDVSGVPFIIPSEGNLLEVEETLPGGFDAHAKAFAVWTPYTRWVLPGLSTDELHGARFIPLDEVMNPAKGMLMRELTQGVLAQMFDRGLMRPPRASDPRTFMTSPVPAYEKDFRYSPTLMR